jgi:hypothetical protein
MGESSYEKVYRLLAVSLEGRRLEGAVRHGIESTRVSGVSFYLNKSGSLGQPATARPVYTISTDSNPHMMKVESADRVWFDASAYMSDEAAISVINANFGVKGRVPTYFCKKEVVTGEKYRHGTVSFPKWLSAAFNEKFRSQLTEARNRVEDQISRMKGSKEYADSEREFLTKCAIRDIKAAMAAYRHLGDEALKQAVQEFLCDDVFEFGG